MIMPPAVRKFVLAIHLSSSVGWVGAVVGYIALDVTVATSQDPQMLRAAWMAMGLVASWAIVPLAFAALITGLVMSVGTRWGLIRHWWVLISLGLTIVAVIVLVSELRVINGSASVAADQSTTNEDLRALPSTLPHSVGGLAVLLVIQVLNVYKPRGMTRYGWRKQREERRAQQWSRQADQRTSVVTPVDR